MARIAFQGVIVSIGTGVNPELAICCASRLGLKDWRVISLEGKFADKFPDLKLDAGFLVSGQASLLEIWDGSILVQFMAEEFQILPDDKLTDLMGNLLKSNCIPRAERKISLAGKEFYRFRLDKTYYPRQIKWDQRQSPLGSLSRSLLTEDGESMALLTGYALLFAKARIRHGKWSRKDGIFLLANRQAQTHTPIFMFADANIGEPWQKGWFYHFDDLPILYNNDTLRSSPAGGAESTLFCGKGKFEIVHTPDDELLSFFYDELGDVAYMPEWLWHKYFGRRLDRNLVKLWQAQIGALLQKTGKFPKEKAHGWWYAWNHATTLKRNDAAGTSIAILVPDFADGGMPRIIALPEDVYKANRKSFPAYSIAVSVSSNPEILEGAWRPDPQSLILIKSWIRTNEAALRRDIIFAGDFNDID